jgi:trehalose/maltose hydrolase-like predicted phosphorylase
MPKSIDELPKTFQLDMRLTVHESALLLKMCSYAAVIAMKNKEAFAIDFVRLTNKINEQNPNWTPIEVPN